MSVLPSTHADSMYVIVVPIILIMLLFIFDDTADSSKPVFASVVIGVCALAIYFIRSSKTK